MCVYVLLKGFEPSRPDRGLEHKWFQHLESEKPGNSGLCSKFNDIRGHKGDLGGEA